MSILKGTFTISPHKRPGHQLLVLLFILFLAPLKGQEIRISADHAPLSTVLMDMAVEYQLQISFDERSLSAYKVSVDTSFIGTDAAIDWLLSGLPLEHRLIGEVYTIYPKMTVKPRQIYHYAGSILDGKTGESLPLVHILMGDKGIVSDVNGHFSFSSQDSALDLSFSYLGYYRKDSLVSPGRKLNIGLQASSVDLKPVLVQSAMVVRSGQIGEVAGMQRLNHQIAYRLPGNGDNSVFNFLRLQPGIQAAGESSAEMSIWGSYNGQTRILFDGFTVFGLKNFNDNLSFVNPYMAKDIRVYKGAYGPEFDNRVGGIVDISGYEGSLDKPSINVNINNMTINGMASIPLGERSSLVAAYRNTYYNLINPEDLNLSFAGKQPSQQADVTIYPDYNFRDMNVKYAGESKKGSPFHISYYQGRDQFSYEVENERNNFTVYQEALENNLQRGGNIYYGKNWKKGARSHFSLSYSGLDKDKFEKQGVEGNSGGSEQFLTLNREVTFDNMVREWSLRNSNQFSIRQHHSLELGWNYNLEKVGFSEDSLNLDLDVDQASHHRAGTWIKGLIQPAGWLSIEPGLRFDYLFSLQKAYLLPNMRISADLDEYWKLNLAGGLYAQYMGQTSVVDALGNYSYLWTIADGDNYLPQRSLQAAAGLSYQNKGLSISVEGFYKRIHDMSRIVYLWRSDFQEIYRGDAKVYGIDAMIKKYFSHHEAWISYSYSQTMEHFGYMQEDVYRFSPHDQRHEIKGVMLLNFHPIYFSSTYVYGSGFIQPRDYTDPDWEPVRFPYHRLDVALIYKHSISGYHFDIGLSVLNVLNHENIRHSSLIQLPDTSQGTVSIHAEAMPFTPAIYLNMKF